MTLEQCIQAIGAPHTGVGSSSFFTVLLAFFLIIVAIAVVFGIYLFSTNRHTRRALAHRPGRSSTARNLFSLLALASILATGALTMTTQSFAQQVPTECAQHANSGSGAGDTAPQVRTMQTFTPAECAALPVYDGTNPTAILTLKDPRGGGAGQDYQVAKLADNNCWMLDNLRLGSATAPITLTPADSDVASNFTLPQVDDGTTPASQSDTTPFIYGPVLDPGDPSIDYGYLYNWPATIVTANLATTPVAINTHAPQSICPVNWRLPRGGADVGSFLPTPANEFSQLDARMAGFPSSQDPTYLTNYSSAANAANWLPTGPLKGSLGGGWGGYFVGQGLLVLLWSASAYSLPGDAWYAHSTVGYVNPGTYYPREYGLGVRCLLR